MAVLETSFKILNLVFGAGGAVQQRAMVEAKPHFTPLLIMPEGSETKMPLITKILSRMWHFDDLYLLYAEGLEAIVKGVGVVARDTKAVIDHSHPLRVFINTNDASKYKWIENYTVRLGIKAVNMFGNAERWVRKIKPSNNRSLVYINGAFVEAQTPELVNFIKGILPNSIIIMVIIDPYKSQATRNPKSLAYKYGRCMSEYIESFGNICNHRASFISYGYNRYLAIV